MIDKQSRDKKIKIKAELRDQVYKAIPTQYSRYVGRGLYFIPIFGNWYWKRLEIVLELAELFTPKKELNIEDFGVVSAYL